MFRRQAEHFALLGSPIYGRLAGLLAGDAAAADGRPDYHGNWIDWLDAG